MFHLVKSRLDLLLAAGGIAISFGWNTAGMGAVRKYDLIEILIVNHGGVHNDTLVTVERKMQSNLFAPVVEESQ